MGTDPVTSQLIESAIRLWDRREAFLWSLAIAGGAVYAILFGGAYLGWSGTREAFASYGLWTLIWTIVFAMPVNRESEARQVPEVNPANADQRVQQPANKRGEWGCPAVLSPPVEMIPLAAKTGPFGDMRTFSAAP